MAPPGPKCLIPNGDSQNSHNDAAQIIQKLHQLEVGQKKIIHLLNNLDKELSAREKRQGQCCFKHNNSSLNNGSIKSTSRSFKTESFFIHAIPIPIQAKVEITPSTIILKNWVPQCLKITQMSHFEFSNLSNVWIFTPNITWFSNPVWSKDFI